ncbi:MAG: glycosyltransferase, partial [Desulfosudaceae bacterium]
MPVYNEANTIREMLARVHDVPYRKQIIVVDDG